METELQQKTDSYLEMVAQDLMMRIQWGREHLNADTVPEWFVSVDVARISDWNERLAEIRAEQARRARRER